MAPAQAPSPMETLAKERLNPPFNVRELSVSLHGSEHALKLKEKFMEEISRDPAFRLEDIHDLTKDQIRERTMEKFHNLVHYVTSESLATFTLRMQLIGTADPAFWTRFGVHYGLFLGALRSAATPNQFQYWMDKGVLGLNGVIGCFGMTELKHGSNVAGLETTMTFDEDTDEFVVHTPSLGATKWWIGGAAQTATHCAVFAQMIVKGKCYGVKIIVVQLRDTKTFELMPGINIGDLGKKMGRDGIDNGYIQFTHVRVPRAHLLMKHCQVTREGKVFEPPLAQLAYGALLSGRTAMVADSAATAQKALTIAVRYGVIRRQFKTGDNPLETQLLDYPIHQRRLMPLLSQAVALSFTAKTMSSMYESLSESLETLQPGDSELPAVLEKLKETHATSAGLKAFSTWATLDTIEKARQTLGGHGFSSYSGFPSMLADHAVHCTWEGDNTILSLQSGRALIARYFDAVKGKHLADGVAYLARKGILTAKAPSSVESVRNLAVIDDAWACVAANTVEKAAKDFQAHLKSGKGKEEAFELCSQSRFVAAKTHTTGYIYRTFRNALESEKGPVRDVLELCCRLYGLWQIEESAGIHLQYGFFNGQHLDAIHAQVNELCLQLRKVAVPVVDSFALSDHIINSPLGRFDGNIYEAYFAKIQAANPQKSAKDHPYFQKLILPLLERQPPQEDDTDQIELDTEIAEILAERKAGEERR